MLNSKARLDIDAAHAIPRFRQVAEASDLRIQEESGGLRIALPRATLTVRSEGSVTAVEVDSPDAVGLQLMRDLLAERIGAQGLTLHWQDALAGQQPGNLSHGRVVSAARLSPSYTPPPSSP